MKKVITFITVVFFSMLIPTSCGIFIEKLEFPPAEKGWEWVEIKGLNDKSPSTKKEMTFLYKVDGDARVLEIGEKNDSDPTRGTIISKTRVYFANRISEITVRIKQRSSDTTQIESRLILTNYLQAFVKLKN